MTEAMPFLQKYDITFLRPPTIGRALFFTEFLTERGESLLHKLKRDESSG